MDPNKEIKEGFPSIPSNDLDDENPYVIKPENNNIFQKTDTIDLDPDKGNISDQLGLEFDYPTITKIFKHNSQENNQNEVNNNFNNDNDNNNNKNRNFLDNFDSPIDLSDLPNDNKINNFDNNNNNNNFNNNDNEGNNMKYPNLSEVFDKNNNNIQNNNNYGNKNNYENNNNNYGNNNYGYKNNYENNFGGPNNYNNNPNNNFNNDNFEQMKKIQNIITACDTKFKSAIAQYKNYQVIESKKNLINLINTLNTLEKTIKEKNKYASPLLPNIDSLKSSISKKYYEYNYFTYILTSNLFQNIQYKNGYDISKFAENFIITRYFITFNDIIDTSFDPNFSTKETLLNIFSRAQKSGEKTLFLYGPKGSGKTLYVHALANELGAVLGQIDNLQTIKIKYFVREFSKLICDYLTRPIIVFVKNVDILSKEALGDITFLRDKFCGYQKSVLFICSSAFPIKNLPPQLKFKYVHLINSANQANKCNFFKNLTNKFGIKVSMNDNELNDFVIQNFKNYSNRDVFQVIKSTMDIRKRSGGSIFEIGRNDLEQALKIVKGSLDQQTTQFYGL